MESMLRCVPIVMLQILMFFFVFSLLFVQNVERIPRYLPRLLARHRPRLSLLAHHRPRLLSSLVALVLTSRMGTLLSPMLHPIAAQMLVLLLYAILIQPAPLAILDQGVDL